MDGGFIAEYEAANKRQKPSKKDGDRTSKITNPDSMNTDIRDYRPKVIIGGKLVWDFSPDDRDPGF